MMIRAIIASVLVALLAATAQADVYYVVEGLQGGFDVLPAADAPLPPSTVVAIVNYTNSLLQTGWDVLNITTTATYSDLDQAYAAGYGEGAVTWQSTWDNYQNNQFSPNQPPMPANITVWVQKNWDWMKYQVAALNSTSPMWYQVGLIMRQFEGLLDGLNYAAPNASMQITFDMLQSINLAGDLSDLYNALNISTMSSTWRTMPKQEYMNWFGRSTHCSALVKLKYDYSEIFIGHATWSTYNMMMRSYKTYTLNYRGVPAKTITFSGYAGVLVSIDDFYTSSAGLVVTETSFTILNNSLYAYCNPELLFYWVRVLVATRLATSGEEWTTLFSQLNSGTYNNQWMVLDTKLFTPYQDLLPGTLYIAEQIPGQVGVFDATSTLQYGYWPSYNIPSIPSIFELSGNAEAVATQGWEMNDYERCVRAQIFRRDQSKVVDMESMEFMLQYNDYKHDPVSQGDPTYTIASRGDLTAQMPMCWGAIDAKVTSVSQMKAGQRVQAYSGPTPQQGPFNVLTTNATMMCAHQGQPTLWNFSFVEMTV